MSFSQREAVAEIVLQPIDDKTSERAISLDDKNCDVPTAEADNGEPVVADAQAGVQRIEAIASAWSRRSLVAAYIMIWLIYFWEYMLQVVQASLTPYVTSSYAEHSLTPTVGVLSSIIGGCCNLTMAKILDIIGRPQGFLLCIVLATVGLVLMAACRSIEMYATAQVFYTLGNTMLQYTLGLFIADTTHLRNRGLLVAFSSTPNLIIVWAAGPMAQAFLEGPGWPWAFGTFAIIIPVVALPLCFLFLYFEKQAEKESVMPKRATHDGIRDSIVFYLREFDIVGLILVTCGLALFLLPFSLYSFQTDGWRSNLVICLIVFGFTLLIAFAAWECYFAPVQFIPFHLLTDRTVFNAYILGFTLFASYYVWYAYFSSFLQVVNNVSVTDASYIMNGNTIMSCFACILAGVVIRRTGRFKPLALFVGIPVSILAVGLMIYFRHPDQSVGYLVMCQIFVGLGSGIIIITDQVAAMSNTTHQHFAAILAIDGLFSNIGSSVGLTIAAAIWTSILPTRLLRYLPAEQQENLVLIYSDLTTQLSFPIGSETRLAVQHAYGDAMMMLYIAGTAFWVVGIVALLLWRDTNVQNIKQVKGLVF